MAAKSSRGQINVVDRAMHEARYGTPAGLRKALDAADFGDMAKSAFMVVQGAMRHIADGSAAGLQQVLRSADFAALGNAAILLSNEAQRYHDAGLSHRTDLWVPAANAAKAIAAEVRRRTQANAAPARSHAGG